MSVLKSVSLAIQVATGKRDEVAKGLLHVLRTHAFAQDQMAQLESYAAETEARWAAAARTGTTPELMRHHYQFMARLQHAIGLQVGVLDNTARHVESSRRSLLEAEFRLAGLKQVLRKKQADMLVLQSRREQQQMDEFASQRGRRGAQAHASGERS